MTIQECMDEIDAIEPNAYSEAQKASWILRAEGSVATGIYLLPPSAVSTLTDAGDYPLLAPPPFDKLYPLYLHAMIHYANSEYERYQNDMQLYNAAYGEFARWFAAKYEPALTKRDAGEISGSAALAGSGDDEAETAHTAVKAGDVLTDIAASTEEHVYFELLFESRPGYSEDIISTSGEWDGEERRIMPYVVPSDGEVYGYAISRLISPTEVHFRCRVTRYGWPDRFGRTK